jgi:serine/threonine-protein kinase
MPGRLVRRHGVRSVESGAQIGRIADFGSRIGPFELLRPLGGRSNARLAAARDLRNGSLVALKVVDLDGGSSEPAAAAAARERFVREALAVGRLRHRDLVEVFGAGQAGGQGWVAMELVPGANLARYTRPARLLPTGVVAAIGCRVAKALAFAHCAGVVHRDVKPENIIVDWSTDSVKLVDFGLAHWSDQARTTSGQLLGSPDYMAPELFAGAGAGPATDMYALGVSLYELLAGCRPHSAETLGALIRAAANDPVPELAAVNPELPPALCQAVMALLAKVPARRIADAQGLADRLAALATQPGRP